MVAYTICGRYLRQSEVPEIAFNVVEFGFKPTDAMHAGDVAMVTSQLFK